MSAEIKNLSPQHVWGYFYDLTQIPRPTGHMEAVTRFVEAFGKGLGLETLRDGAGNGHSRNGRPQNSNPAISPGYGSPEKFFCET